MDAYIANANKPVDYLERCVKELAETRRIVPKDLRTSSFLKWESYDEIKFPRSINAYSTRTNVALGRYFQLADKSVFGLRNVQGNLFVKNIPVRERPSHLESRFGNRPVNTTDFSSMECHHRGIYTEVAWFWIHHVLRAVADEHSLTLVREMLFGNNNCDFGGIEARIPHTLMSGALWTSSQNGVLNMLLMSYCVLRTRHPNASIAELVRRFDEFNGCFEGDDGIFEGDIDPQLVKDLGLKLKLKSHDSYHGASFCGIVKMATENTIFTDPIKSICDFFVLRAQFGLARTALAKAQLRAKALSYYYQYANCPIVGPLAYAVLMHTRGHNVDENTERDWYKRYVLREALEEAKKQTETEKFYKQPPNVSPQARDFVYQTYGLDPAWQILYEEQIAKWALGLPHNLPPHPKLDQYYRHGETHIGNYDPRDENEGNTYCFGDEYISEEGTWILGADPKETGLPTKRVFGIYAHPSVYLRGTTTQPTRVS